ncbi:hypothetical protein EWM64_g10527 [Hericium alpestre]|uniref:Uncharacterized protein n=1 Tax=Hericium alpestre TaxID=135208 RepID=A0A4Y9ZFG7_9AGAM|nr:hypothetical protein EWM64_g10527 [Hericium alpestre]
MDDGGTIDLSLQSLGPSAVDLLFNQPTSLLTPLSHHEMTQTQEMADELVPTWPVTPIPDEEAVSQPMVAEDPADESEDDAGSCKCPWGPSTSSLPKTPEVPAHRKTQLHTVKGGASSTAQPGPSGTTPLKLKHCRGVGPSDDQAVSTEAMQEEGQNEEMEED